MDVFKLRDQLIADYSSYVTSFIRIQDERIQELVQREVAGGLLWPEPLIQPNPAFAQGTTIDDLVGEGRRQGNTAGSG